MDIDSIFAVNKPKGMTSHDVINRLRKITGVKRIGHAGTLDPLASGVLVVGVGRSATKRLSSELAKEKEYVATLKLGFESTTDDEEGEKNKILNSEFIIQNEITKEKIYEVIQMFVGDSMQVPPNFSAVHVKGKRAYKIARAGKTVELEARRVFIKSIELLEYESPMLTLKVVTGPGVYIRSLARDIGRKLATGAYLSDLQRTRVGEYAIENAFHLDTLNLSEITGNASNKSVS